jgi:hypothetical protein
VGATGVDVVFSPDGRFVRYRGAGGALAVFATTGIGIDNTVGIGAPNAPDRFTRDSAYLVWMASYSTSTQGGLLRLSSISGSRPIQLAANGTTYGLEAMSPDRQWLVWYTAPTSLGVGDLVLAPASTLTAGAVARAVWWHVWAEARPRLVFLADSDGTVGDVAALDTTQPAAGPTTIARGAYVQPTDAVGFAVVGDTVLYTLRSGAPTDGVYLAPLP